MDSQMNTNNTITTRCCYQGIQVKTRARKYLSIKNIRTTRLNIDCCFRPFGINNVNFITKRKTKNQIIINRIVFVKRIKINIIIKNCIAIINKTRRCTLWFCECYIPVFQLLSSIETISPISKSHKV